MPVEADVVAPFLRRRGRTIAMNDGHVEKVGLTKPQYQYLLNPPGALNLRAELREWPDKRRCRVA
jgi:hypothetical protein